MGEFKDRIIASMEPTADDERRMPHPWSRDPVAQAAVRAAEDDAANWRRLEAGEVIEDGDEFLSSMDGKWRRTAAIGTPAVGSITYRRRRVPPPDHRELTQAVAELRERVAKIEEAMVSGSTWFRKSDQPAPPPPSAPPQPAPVPPAPVSRPAETEQTQAERVQSQAEPWKWWNPLPSSCGALHPTPSTQPAPVPPADGLRTERVTLEVTHRSPVSVEGWALHSMLSLEGGESVRVVEDADAARDEAIAHGATLNALAEARESLAAANRGIDRLTAERDAALRERDAAKEECERRLTMCEFMKRQRDAAQFNVSCLKARVAHLEAARAANAGGEQQEPVAWGVRHPDDEWVCILSSRPRECGGYTVVPLYAAPQPPRGWLTEEERKCLTRILDNVCVSRETDECIESLLARETPPKVKMPPAAQGETPLVRDLMWGQAIREAGGEVE